MPLLKPTHALAAGLAAALALLLALGVLAWRSSAQQAEHAADALRAQQALTALATLQSAATDAETAQRGYALTGDPAFLEPYLPAKASAEAQVVLLRKLLADNAEQFTRLVALGPLLATRFDAIATALEPRRRIVPGPSQAPLQGNLAEGKRLHDRLRAAVAELQVQAHNDLAAAQQRSEGNAGNTQKLIAIGTLLALALVGGGGWRLAHGVAALRRARSAEAQARALQRTADTALQQVLDAVPDALCLLDSEGRFLHANAGCQRLWGTPREELVGQLYIYTVLPDDRRKTEQALAAAVNGAQDFRNHSKRADGSTALLAWSARWSGELNNLICMAHDITEVEAMRAKAARMGQAMHAASSELNTATEKAAQAQQLVAGLLRGHAERLRSPPVAITSMSDILLQGLAGPLAPEQQRQLRSVRDIARQLQGRINAMLDLAALEAGHLVLAHDPVDLWELVNQVATDMRAVAQDKGTRLQLELADSLGYARGDAARVSQVLRELLGQAIARSGGRKVTLLAAPDAALLTMAVADSGPALDAQALDAVFEPLDSDAGLALAVARRLARRMGGDIMAASNSGDGAGGCTFIFTLPADGLPQG